MGSRPNLDLAIDSKLSGCDLVRLTIDDAVGGSIVRDRATVIQKKTGRPVQFEITEQTRSAIGEWLAKLKVGRGRYLFPSRFREQQHISTRQDARIVQRWVARAGLDSSAYGTHSMRRMKPAQIYQKTGNLRAVQLLLGHTKLESTVISGSRWMTRSPSRNRSSCRTARAPAVMAHQDRGAICGRLAICLIAVIARREARGPSCRVPR